MDAQRAPVLDGEFHKRTPVYVLFMGRMSAQTCEAIYSTVNGTRIQGHEDISLNIITTGGDCTPAEWLFEELQSMVSRGMRLSTHNAGFVNSAGIYPYLAGERRSAAPESTFLFHQPKMLDERGVIGIPTLGIEDFIQLITEKKLHRMLTDRTGMTEHEAIELCGPTDRILTPEEASRAGIAHDIHNAVIPPNAELIVLNFKETMEGTVV